MTLLATSFSRRSISDDRESCARRAIELARKPVRIATKAKRGTERNLVLRNCSLSLISLTGRGRPQQAAVSPTCREAEAVSLEHHLGHHPEAVRNLQALLRQVPQEEVGRESDSPPCHPEHRRITAAEPVALREPLLRH